MARRHCHWTASNCSAATLLCLQPRCAKANRVYPIEAYRHQACYNPKQKQCNCQHQPFLEFGFHTIGPHRQACLYAASKRLYQRFVWYDKGKCAFQADFVSWEPQRSASMVKPLTFPGTKRHAASPLRPKYGIRSSCSKSSKGKELTLASLKAIQPAGAIPNRPNLKEFEAASFEGNEAYTVYSIGLPMALPVLSMLSMPFRFDVRGLFLETELVFRARHRYPTASPQWQVALRFRCWPSSRWTFKSYWQNLASHSDNAVEWQTSELQRSLFLNRPLLSNDTLSCCVCVYQRQARDLLSFEFKGTSPWKVFLWVWLETR